MSGGGAAARATVRTDSLDAAADVLVVVNDLRPYGSQRVTSSLVEEWQRVGFTVVVVTLEAPSVEDVELPQGVGLVRLVRPRSRAAALPSLRRQLAQVMRAVSPTHVVSHMTLSNVVTLLASPARRGLDVTVVEHSVLSTSLSGAGGLLLGVLLRLLQHRARWFVGVSDAVVEDLRTRCGISPARLVRQYNAVPHRVPRSARPPHPWLDGSDRPVVVTCVGGLRTVKGQDVLIRAVAATSDVRALLVGDGPERQELGRLVVRLGLASRVALVGYQDDIASWVTHSDAVVIPSRSESFGLVAVEAGRLGVPVLASDVHGLRELVPRHAAGHRFPVADVEALAVLLADLSPRRGAGSGSGSGEREADPFDPAVAAEHFLALLVGGSDAAPSSRRQELGAPPGPRKSGR